MRGALEPMLDDEAEAGALTRAMAALATPLPAGVGYASRVERPLLWRDGRYRAEATRRRRAAADPDRPYAAWSMTAQAAALRLLDRALFDDPAWELLSEFDAVNADDTEIVRRIVAMAG